MSKRKKREAAPGPTAKLSAERGLLFGALGLGIVIVVGALAVSWNHARTERPQLTPPEAASTASVGAPPKAAFQKLIGKWVRPDGGYVLQIQQAENSGKLEAAYFNPSPIHVAKAQALEQGSAVKVYVELRDVNYPGSSYTLVYDPASDQLKGTYYQAVDRERYDILFDRLK